MYVYPFLNVRFRFPSPVYISAAAAITLGIFQSELEVGGPGSLFLFASSRTIACWRAGVRWISSHLQKPDRGHYRSTESWYITLLRLRTADRVLPIALVSGRRSLPFSI